jgi:hypothetical protein
MSLFLKLLLSQCLQPGGCDDLRLFREGRLTALCMLVCALVIIGLAVTGVLQLRWASPPIAHISAK